MTLPRKDWEHLSIPERIELVEDIWDSIAEESDRLPLTDAQRAELNRRLALYEQDPGATRTWSEVRERLEREE